MPDVRILVIDDDAASQRALKLILDSDGWEIQMAALPDTALQKLAAGGWNLVIANVSMSSLSGPLFDLLKDLSKTEGSSLRVLFLVPAIAESEALEMLERLRLPYATKPLHLHDFLEQVGDLLRAGGAIAGPLQGFREGGPSAPKPHLKDARRMKAKEGEGAMFAERDDYAYDEEELKKFEEEERRKAEGEPSDSDSH